MRQCDIAVVGLGLMGSAALEALVRAGVDALGFDPLAAGAGRGSSHGSCRIFRRYNFENVDYTGLSDAAHEGWRRLEQVGGRPLLIPAPVLEAGPAGSEMVAASRGAAEARGPGARLLSGAEVNDRFPAFNLPRTWDAVVQDGGAILQAQAALEVMRAQVGGRVIAERAEIAPGPDHILVRTATHAVRARTVILALGPWIGDVLPELRPVLRVTRQAVGWFSPAQPPDVALGAFPIFLLARSPQDVVYGFPDFEGRGVKAAAHNHGREVGADGWDPPATDTELGQTSRALAELVPGAFGPIVEREVCLYTNTLPADLRPDAGEEFIIDRLPSDPRLIVASPCSGHGAKFAPAIGEMLARLALDPDYRAEPSFQLSRYVRFSTKSPNPQIA